MAWPITHILVNQIVFYDEWGVFDHVLCFKIHWHNSWSLSLYFLSFVLVYSLIIHISYLTDRLCLFIPGEATKFGRNDSSSPAPPTSLSTAGVQSQPQQAPQAGTQGQGQGQGQGQQTQNQAFLNPPLPPGYGYTGEDEQNYISWWGCQTDISSQAFPVNS